MIPLGPAGWAGYRWIHIGDLADQLWDFHVSIGNSLIGTAASFHYDDEAFLGEPTEIFHV